MIQVFKYFAVLALLSGCVTTPGHNPRDAPATNLDELDRTWAGGHVYIPNTPGGTGQVAGFGRTSNMDKPLAKLGAAPRYPAIVYLHGCSGRGIAARTTGAFLAKAGYLIVQPDSFARAYKPKSCDPRTKRGGLHRDAVAWRRAEAAHAIRRVRGWPFVDPRNVFLMGFSQGGITTATFEGKREAEAVRGRIIEGWTCHSGWADHDGLAATDNEPVLALLGERDPWFIKLPSTRGHCGQRMNTSNGSASHVFTSPLANKHHMIAYPDIQKLVVDFLDRHRLR